MREGDEERPEGYKRVESRLGSRELIEVCCHGIQPALNRKAHARGVDEED